MPDAPARKTLILTSLAMLAFAGNSILCRLALDSDAIGAADFTAIRLFAGAVVLALLLGLTPTTQRGRSRGSWFAAALLFAYAAAFSWAYRLLDAGTGALILFAAVQLTMFVAALAKGERTGRLQTVGIVLALGGFGVLVAPGVSAPPLTGALLMSLSGIAWGGYTLHGRRSRAPLPATAWNFIRALPLAGLLVLSVTDSQPLTGSGILLAALSGGLASGIGYAIWFAALAGLTTFRASVVQLVVPVLTAGGGLLFLDEALTLRLVLAAIAVLGGIALTLVAPENPSHKE